MTLASHAEQTPPAPDLVPPTSPLAPVFPLSIQDTRVVLHDGAPGEVRAHWFLRANDVIGIGADFPAAGGQPQPVLRLLRLGDDGGTEPVATVRLRLAGQGGAGQSGFQVGWEGARFAAELGLVNGDGGWLLLARSNRFQHAPGIGLAFPAHAAGDGVQEAVRLDETRPSAPVPIQGLSGEDAPILPAMQQPLPLVEAGPARLVTAFVAAGGTAAPSIDGDAMDRQSAIPTLIYGQPVVPAAGLLIEAELRIQGWAAPNTQIDLFGHAYFVGPGGRFQFVLKVDDPALLRQALALHPPAELLAPRDD